MRAGVVSTLAGSCEGFLDGVARAAKFNSPTSVAVDPETGNMLVADRDNHRIRRVDRRGAVTSVTTVCGREEGFMNGIGRHRSFFERPCGIIIHPVNGSMLVADTENNKLRKIMFMDHWTMARHEQRTLQLRGVVSLVVGVQHILQHRLQQSQTPRLWLPRELWFFVFTFLHDLDFTHLRELAGLCAPLLR